MSLPHLSTAAHIKVITQTFLIVGVQDDFGDEEAGDSEGRAKDQMVESEEERLL